MAIRIAGVTLANEKRIEAALLGVYGLGLNRINKALKDTKVSPDIRVKDLTEVDANKIRSYIEKNFKVEGDLRREVLLNIKRLKEIKCYRGTRHQKHLPTRGQRTKVNSRTVRGNVRVTMMSGRKKSAEKT